MKNIVLIGFMGTGKTAIGQMLAQTLGVKYVSTDDVIEEKAGKKISDIFQQDGEPSFREMECNVVKELSGKNDIVIDTGGGIVLNPNNIHLLRKNGNIICLWSSPEVIYKRVKEHTHRPLLSVKDPLQKIKDILEQRRPLYEGADYFVNTDKMTLEQVVGSIITWISKK
ncbi:MAG: shikimate kinase [Candidatus Omnitrophica bacterium]|nr:shikimate kinase [Candidatus Omnitrophota bacterium]